MWRQINFLIFVFLFFLNLPANFLAQNQPATDQSSLAPTAGKEVPKVGTIRGIVIGTDTDAGLKKVTLVLQNIQSQGGEPTSSTQTDANGEYRFENVKPGKYSLSAYRNGYVDAVYGQKSGNPFSQRGGITLDVRAGQSLNSINLKLIRGGAIEGRIVDSDNEPVARAIVQVARYTSIRGKRQLVASGTASTDDLGRYRLFNIPPGLYYLQSAYRGWERQESGLSSPPTYYPGVMTPQEATKIQVRAGRDITGIDVTLVETKVYSVSGKAVGFDGKPFGNGLVIPMRLPMGGALWGSRPAVSDFQGQFKLKGLFPGKYRISATTERDGKRFSGRQSDF
ncbi:MAG: carboxypeptidase-like regulatory domain-containing protein [Terriglobia bacterium]